jgi:hypothetical protein
VRPLQPQFVPFAKAEEHFITGTGLAFGDNLNLNLPPTSKRTARKVGFTF